MNALVTRDRWAFSRSQTLQQRRTNLPAIGAQGQDGTAARDAGAEMTSIQRPAGATPTTLETSRRLLTRRSTGVSPSCAQIVSDRARKLWPVSSTSEMVRCSRFAFFGSHPIPLRPDGDHQLIVFLGPCGRMLHETDGVRSRYRERRSPGRIVILFEHSLYVGRIIRDSMRCTLLLRILLGSPMELNESKEVTISFDSRYHLAIHCLRESSWRLPIPNGANDRVQ